MQARIYPHEFLQGELAKLIPLAIAGREETVSLSCSMLKLNWVFSCRCCHKLWFLDLLCSLMDFHPARVMVSFFLCITYFRHHHHAFDTFVWSMSGRQRWRRNVFLSSHQRVLWLTPTDWALIPPSFILKWALLGGGSKSLAFGVEMLDYDTRRLIGSPQSERGLMFGRRRSLQCRCNWLRCNRQLSSQRSIPIGLLAVVLSLALDAKEPCIRFYIFLSLRCHRHCFFCIEEILGHRANETFVFLTLALFFLLFSFCLHTF